MRFLGQLSVALVVLQPLLDAQSVPAGKTCPLLHVQLSSEFHHAVSGRLLIFVAPGGGAKEVDMRPFEPTHTYLVAKDVPSWSPGTTIDVDTDDVAFPSPLSGAQPGDYQLQAVLDVGFDYNYSGRSAGDLISDIVTLSSWNPARGVEQMITLSRTVPPASPRASPNPSTTANREPIHPLSLTSRALTAFWGREVLVRGFVVTPPSYRARPQQRFPAVYYTHGFGGRLPYLQPVAEDLYDRMARKKMPEMIWVLLDESSPTGTHEFADSVNNGPWGTALTTELIPYLERTYRMDATARGRFLQGHSSGGWATLWLQTRYPRIFGGTWSTSPDPSDFHDFTGVNLYAPHANFYRKPDGSPYPLIRNKRKVVATLEQFARLEQTIGPYGGQFASFDWVFSPRGADGRPMPMFNRATGDVDPAVMAYWKDHYDIANLVSRQWKAIGPDLRGKIHVIVGTADTFYLDGPAHKLQAVLDGLHAGAHFTFIPDRTHFDLYKVGSDKNGLMDQMAAEMYAVARPPKKTRSNESPREPVVKPRL